MFEVAAILCESTSESSPWERRPTKTGIIEPQRLPDYDQWRTCWHKAPCENNAKSFGSILSAEISCDNDVIMPSTYLRHLTGSWNDSIESPSPRFSVFGKQSIYDDVIKSKHFPRYWPFVRGIHRSPVNSPHKGQWRGERPVTRSFDVFFDLRLNKRLSKQSWGWWFEALRHPLWRHSNGFFDTGELSSF